MHETVFIVIHPSFREVGRGNSGFLGKRGLELIRSDSNDQEGSARETCMSHSLVRKTIHKHYWLLLPTSWCWQLIQ
jgi:hypothetical protein